MDEQLVVVFISEVQTQYKPVKHRIATLTDSKTNKILLKDVPLKDIADYIHGLKGWVKIQNAEIVLLSLMHWEGQ